MLEELAEGLRAASNDPAVHAVILTGTGKYYCAGVDFSGGFAPMYPSNLIKDIMSKNQSLFDNFINFKKPLIAALNGPALGAAATSSLLCDVVVCSNTAYFLTPFKSLGLVPEGCSSYVFPKLLGQELGKQVLEGRKLEALEALQLGFVDKVSAIP